MLAESKTLSKVSFDRIKVTIWSITYRNNEIAADTMLVVQVKQEGGQAEPPIVTLEEGDGIIIINTSSGSLQTAPSVIGPWENVAAPLQLNLNELGEAGFFRAVN